MGIRVAMAGLGCAKNMVDAERMLFDLHHSGYEIETDVSNAEVVIVNTCGFIKDAKEEAIETILEYSELKKEGRIKGIVVTGCLAQRYANEIREQMPEVNCVLSPGCNDRIGEAVEIAAKGGNLELFNKPEQLSLEGDRVITSPDGMAYLKIADGCDNRCSYCTIPLIRGPFRSRPMENILAEAKDLLAAGYSELVLIAQDTTRYGEDFGGKSLLPQLMKQLCQLEGLVWLRALYFYPDRITDELLEVMATEDKIVKYIDLPLQHASAKVLKAMNRRGTAAEYLALLEKIRAKIPGVVLRTTFIVGFPVEDKASFEELAEFVRQARFDRMGCFIYSREDDTPAADIVGGASERTAGKRRDLLMLEQGRIMEQINEKRLHQTVRVLVEGFDKFAECWYGRSAAEAPEVDGKIFFTAKNKPVSGQMVDVTLDEVIDYDMMGHRV